MPDRLFSWYYANLITWEKRGSDKCKLSIFTVYFLVASSGRSVQFCQHYFNLFIHFKFQHLFFSILQQFNPFKPSGILVKGIKNIRRRPLRSSQDRQVGKSRVSRAVAISRAYYVSRSLNHQAFGCRQLFQYRSYRVAGVPIGTLQHPGEFDDYLAAKVNLRLYFRRAGQLYGFLSRAQVVPTQGFSTGQFRWILNPLDYCFYRLQ